MSSYEILKLCYSSSEAGLRKEGRLKTLPLKRKIPLKEGSQNSSMVCFADRLEFLFKCCARC